MIHIHGATNIEIATRQAGAPVLVTVTGEDGGIDLELVLHPPTARDEVTVQVVDAKEKFLAEAEARITAEIKAAKDNEG